MDLSQDDSSESEDHIAPLLGSRLESNGSAFRPGSAIGVPSTVLEPPNDYRSRWRSIRVMYLIMFLGSVTFTITMSSLWPFLQVLDPSASTGFLGWVVASYSVGQLLASPLFGAWANLSKSSRKPLMVSLVLTVLSNLFYMYLQSIPTDKKYYMILARGVIGFSAGNVAVVRSYVSGATTMKERTGSMANLSIFQTMGFILGPVIQAALVPLKYPGVAEAAYFHFNMYTAPSFFASVMAFISLLLLVFIFKEHHVQDDDINANLQSSNRKKLRNTLDGSLASSGQSDTDEVDYKLDYVAVYSTIVLFFVVLFMFTVFETVGTPLTMHMYAWSKSTATFNQGIILSCAGFFSIIVFLVVKKLSKRFSEKHLLLAGFIISLCAYIVFIPWGDKLPPQSMAPIYNNSKSNATEAPLTSLHPNIFEEDAGHLKQGILNVAHLQNRRHVFSKDEKSHSVRLFTISNDTLLTKDTDVIQSVNSTARSFQTVKEIVWTNISALSTTTEDPNNYSTIPWYNMSTPASDNATSTPEGCPWQYDWCHHVPVIYLAQYLCGTLLLSIGYPMCNVLTYIIYSKVLGPQPQGLWMGWLTASGSLARAIGPIYVSQIYDWYGPQVTFGSSSALILSTIIFFLVVFRRIVPFSFKKESSMRYPYETNHQRQRS